MARGKFGLATLQARIQWRGVVEIDHTNERDESMFAEMMHPPKSIKAKPFYCCVTTGLLFDKQSGVCLQSSRMRLVMDTVESVEGMTARKYAKWLNDRKDRFPYGRAVFAGGDDDES